MKRALFLLTVAGLFMVSCNNVKTKTETTETETATMTEYISVDSFLVVAGNFVGKELTVMGTVDHVCKHGGKRVKMFSSCPSKALHAEAAEGMGQFKAEIEGSDICVTGIVGETKMDLAYFEDYEAEIKEAMKTEAEEVEMEQPKGADHHATLEKIAAWKEEITTNGIGYISTYFLEASKYKECETQKEIEVQIPDSNATAAAPCCASKKEATEAKPDCADIKEEGKECSEEQKAECGHEGDASIGQKN
ncbi:MAG: hypothetical protein JEZ09_12500 [Salinivirgaceae bacterium]|nr:hypothetical protein [Salinivirgaceae bacterium]